MLDLIHKIAPEYSAGIGQIVTEGGDDIYEASYPLLDTDFKIKISSENKALIHSIILKESKFNPTVISSAGAMGLMQLMPNTTAADMAKERKIPLNSADLLTNLRLNIELGSYYVSKLQKEFNSSLLLVLSAYNAGPGNPIKWLTRFKDPRHPDTDPLDWIELLPYSETRNYIHRVLENLFIYKKRIAF